MFFETFLFFFLFRNIIRTTKRNYLFLPDIEIKIASKKKKRDFLKIEEIL